MLKHEIISYYTKPLLEFAKIGPITMQVLILF